MSTSSGLPLTFPEGGLRLNLDELPYPGLPPLRPEDASAGVPVVPGFEVLRVLGRGATGVVYEARQCDLDRVVALKMLHTLSRDPVHLARFRAEAEAIARLAHPNIVQIHGVGTWDGLPYLTLEFVAGGSLADRLRLGPLPPLSAAEVLRTLAGAVHSAHEKGIIHRDLKPANILLTRDGLLKVADFGLAKRLESGADLTRSGVVVGTPTYAAPEVLAGTGEPGPALDIYSLGVILYEMLTGRPPFQAATPADLLVQVRSREPISPRYWQPHCPRDLETICLACLRKDPTTRYPTVLSLADDLTRFLRREPIRARPVGRLGRAWRSCVNRPVLTGLCAATLLLALAVVGVLGLTVVQLRAEKEQTVQALQSARERQQHTAQALQREAKRRQQASAALDEITNTLLQSAQIRRPVSEEERGFLERARAIYEELGRPDEEDAASRLVAARACFRLARVREALGEVREAEKDCQRGLDLLADLPGAGDPESPVGPDAVTVTLARARGHAERGWIRAWHGRHEGAEEDLRRALAILEQLGTSSRRQSPLARELLARVHHDLGGVIQRCADAGADHQRPEAEKHLQKAVALLEDLVREQVARQDLRQSLGQASLCLAWNQVRQGRPADAEQTVRRALRLYADHPRGPLAWQLLHADLLNIQGDIHLRLSQPGEAEAQFRSVVDLRERLRQGYPNLQVNTVRLGGAYCNLGLALMDRRRPAEAVPELDKAVSMLEQEVARAHPPEARQFLLNSLRARAGLLGSLGRFAESARDWGKVFPLLPPGEQASCRAFEALSLALDGQHFEAAGVVEQAQGLNPAPPTLILLARVYCVAAAHPIAGGSPSLLPLPIREKYLTFAVRLLEKATGSARPPGLLEQMLADPCFVPLHGREDFQALVRQLAARKVG